MISSKDNCIQLIKDLVETAAYKVTRPTFLYNMNDNYSIVKGLVAILEEKKENAINLEEYYSSLIKNNCYFIIQEQLISSFIDLLDKNPLPSNQNAMFIFNNINNNSRKLVREENSDLFSFAIDIIEKTLSLKDNPPLFEMELFYVLYRIKSDIYCSLFEEFFTTHKYDNIFKIKDISSDEKFTLIQNLIMDIITSKNDALEKILYR